MNFLKFMKNNKIDMYNEEIKFLENTNEIKQVYLNEYVATLKNTVNKLNKKMTTDNSHIDNKTYFDNCMDVMIFNKPWAKLKKIHKIFKLEEYINNLKNITDDNKNELKIEIIEMFNDKYFQKKKKLIIYDELKMKIEDISCIILDDNNKYIIVKT